MSWTLDHPLQRDVHRLVGSIFLGIIWFKLHKTQLVMRETFFVTLGVRTRHLLLLRRKRWATRTTLLSPFYGQNGRLFPYPDLAYTRRRGVRTYTGSHSTLGGSFLHSSSTCALRHSSSPTTSSALRPSPNLARRFSAAVAFTRCPPAKHCPSHAFSVSSTNT